MTHDELLNGIKEIERIAEGMWGTSALRAVVELHEPYGEIMCVICEGTSYPCSTIQAIEKELG